MKKFLLICIALIFVACDKNYKYVESIEENLTQEEKEDNFTEKNDTLAFLKAYRKFLVSKKLKEDSKRF